MDPVIVVVQEKHSKWQRRLYNNTALIVVVAGFVLGKRAQQGQGEPGINDAEEIDKRWNRTNFCSPEKYEGAQ